MRTLEGLCLFLLGGLGYLAVELAWRGCSHWTMFLAGGAVLCWLAWLEARLPLPAAVPLGAAGTTAVELAVGLYCTRVLRLQVWDYGAEWADVAGLICPKYTLLWAALCAWVLAGMRLARHVSDTSPLYRTKGD